MAQGSRPHVRVVAAEVSEDGRYLLTQRLPTATLPLLWEFPGGRVREGESDQAALERALADRLGVRSDIGEQLLEVRHAYDGYDLTLAVYRAALHGAPRTLRVQALAWALPSELARYEFPGADQHTVDALLSDEG
jgi:8-oxo-dGTP diphosphatase